MAEVLEAVEGIQNDPRLKACFNKAISIVSRTLDLYTASGTAFSFNGGKDSTVLLHIIRAAVEQRRRQGVALEEGAAAANGSSSSGSSASTAAGAAPLGGVLTFFFHHDTDFEEVVAFTRDTDRQYGLSMETLRGDFKQGLEQLLGSAPIRAIILGTRRGDPNAGDQETFCPSSRGWPAFMRVNPILDWTYHDVWAFLKLTAVPYCSLYDRGYTSLGAVSTTEPNSALLLDDGTYLPAHMLPHARLERAGRVQMQRRSLDAGSGGGAQAWARLRESDSCKTAGLLIIGDEVLSAKVEDANTHFLCTQLRGIGWSVDKVVIVRDDVDAICREIRSLSAAHDVVLTAGGLGPTLDDVTMAGLAEAFGQKLALHPQLEARIRAYFGGGGTLTPAHLKMAEAPTGPEVQLIEQRLGGGAHSPFPLLRCRNVYVLPGIPALLQKKWRAVEAHLQANAPQQAPYQTALLRLRLRDETQVAASLEEVAKAAGAGVQLGSYPVSAQQDGAGLVLSLESRCSAALEAACEQLKLRLPADALLSEHRDSGAGAGSRINDTPLSSPQPSGGVALAE